MRLLLLIKKKVWQHCIRKSADIENEELVGNFLAMKETKIRENSPELV